MFTPPLYIFRRVIYVEAGRVPMSGYRIFLVCLCAAFSFLLVAPEYTGINHGNIVPYEQMEPDAWGARFILPSPANLDGITRRSWSPT
jgi:hypothetical protein